MTYFLNKWNTYVLTRRDSDFITEGRPIKDWQIILTLDGIWKRYQMEWHAFLAKSRKGRRLFVGCFNITCFNSKVARYNAAWKANFQNSNIALDLQIMTLDIRSITRRFGKWLSIKIKDLVWELSFYNFYTYLYHSFLY